MNVLGLEDLLTSRVRLIAPTGRMSGWRAFVEGDLNYEANDHSSHRGRRFRFRTTCGS